MEALFLKLLNLSMTASWLILAVVVLRLMFRKAPRWAFCLLWGLVALRLVVPFSLESALSLIPSAEPIPADIVYQAAPAIDSGIPVVNQVVNPVISTTFAPAPVASVNPLQVVTFVAAWVWLIGLILMLGYSLVSYVLLRRRVATATLLRENIKQSERVDSPFVLGLFRPTIYLPYSMGEGDMGHVISHERAHIRRGDHWWKPIGFLILAVYWFNPLMWVAYVLFCRDMELACDEKVVAHMEQEDRRAYSTALLHCGVRRRTVAACPLAFGEVGVKDRVKSVMHYKKPAFWVVLIALLACIVAAVCFLTVPRDDPPHSQEVTGLPAPKSGEDPYEKLEPAERAAAFLANADKLSYELDPIRMYGTTLVPVLEYVPYTVENPTDTETGKLIMDSSQAMLDRLHGFDLSTLEPLEMEEYTPEFIESAVIHVGDARCRMTIWYEKEADGGLVPTGTLVFTFADGTMCAFNNESEEGLLEPLHAAIGMSNSGLGFALQEDQSPWGSTVTVTELATGESKNMPAFAAAYVECIFENTPLLSEQVKSEAEFPWKVEILNGGTYWYNAEENLLMTEENKVYAIGGFETVTSNDQVLSMSDTIELMLPGFVVTLFDYGFEMDMNSGKVTITPPGTNPDPTESIVSTNPSEENLRQKFPEYFDLITSKGLEVYVWKTAENSYHCGVLSGTNRDKTEEEISRLSTNGTSIEEMKLILSSYDISDDKIIIIPYSSSNSSHFLPLDDTDIRDINTSFGYNVTEPVEDTTEPEDDTNWALQQSVWQVTVDGSLSPEDAAWEMAEKIAANYLALPDGTDWKPEDIRVTNAEVFDHYWGETPQFCFNIGLEIKLTQEQRWQTGHWASWGDNTENNGWWPFGAEVYARKSETGDWTYRSWGTGGYSVSLSDGEGLPYLVDCFWLTEGWTHDWILPYTILDMTDAQLTELPALLDERTEAEAKEFCAHLGNMLRENDYWIQTTETLKPILGRYGVYLDA